MSFTLKKNKDLDIKAFQMTCDGRPKNLDKSLPWNFFWGIIGGPGSGKSNTWLNLITRRNKFYYRQFDKIYIFSPSLKTIKKEIKLPQENIFPIFDIDQLNMILEEQTDSDENTLIILDDVISQIKANTEELIRLAYNRRHIGKGLSMIIVSQKYNKIPLDLRVCLSDIIMFNKSKKEIDTLFQEYVNLERKEFDNLIGFVFDEPHSFLYIKTQAPTRKKFYKKFDLIELET